jgi:uncharacterized protein (DUF1697 family)
MTRYVAFLRAINVGGRVVAMSALKAHFAELGLQQVETFIASGNVMFSSSKSAPVLTAGIERRLREGLGYEVATFLRTDKEVSAIAVAAPFSTAEMSSAGALVVGLLVAPLSPSERKMLMGLRTAIDDFHVDGREVYWRCSAKQSESKFSNAVFEKVVGQQTTFRGLSTLRKLAAKLAA